MDPLHAALPVIRLLFPQIQTMVESLKLSITDQQLPMFIRILELIIALYYGEIGGHKESDGEEHGGPVREPGAVLSGEGSVGPGLFLFICTFGLSKGKH